MVIEVRPDWYPDPENDAELRYWDGTVWTDSVATNGITSVSPLIGPLPLPKTSFWQSIWTVLRNYSFEGRAGLSEYWTFKLFQLLCIPVAIVVSIPAVLLETNGGNRLDWLWIPVGLLMVPLALLYLASIVPEVTVTVRRLHDTDRSGWWFWVLLIPYLGALILLVFMCLSGTKGPNRFGESSIWRTWPPPGAQA